MPRTPKRPRDEGTSLVEVIVALGITATVLLALLSTAVFALSATVDARQEQQAADYLNEVLEQARTTDFAALTMSTAQVSGAAGIVTVGGVPQFDAGSGLEAVAASATGLVVPASETRATTNGDYTVRRYVTVPAACTPSTPATTVCSRLDANGQPSVRRVTVEVGWTTKGKPHVRRSSTLITLTRRGLPLPAFTWAYTGPASTPDGVPTWVKNPGNDVDYGFVLQNQGARESWTFSASPSGGWAWYLDTDRDGLWAGDVSEPPLAGAGTGPVEPGAAPINVVAFRTIGAGENGTTTTVFTATPASDPSVTRSVTTQLTVQAGVVTPPTPTASPSASPSATASACNAGSAKGTTSPGSVPSATAPASFTLQQLTLAKSAAGALGDAVASTSAPMPRDTAVLEPTLCNWSTDLHSTQAGRALTSGAASLATQFEWHFQPASRKQDAYEGTPVATLWVQCPSGTPTLTLTLLSLAGSTYTTRATASLPTAGCAAGTFTRYSASITGMPSFTIGLSDRLVLRATTAGAVRLGYGATAVPASLTIGMK